MTIPDPGQIVTVRQRHFVVVEVSKSTLPKNGFHPTKENPQHLVTLSSVEDDALGEELQVIWEIEPGARIHEKVTLPEPAGFDDPRRLDAFLDAVRWGAVSSADVRALQSPFRSGIEIEDYQLDPVVRALQMPRVNLLVADDVGLGKTIEAGLVAQELIIRHRVRSILVVCPASIQIQWRDQMRDKFGLEFRIVDSDLFKQLRRRRGLHVNPWTHFPRLITSFDFLKRERPLRLFREALPAPGQPAFPRKFDLIILDEAHNIAPTGVGRYATDSLRTTAIRVLAPHFEHKLFLTATPHNGYPESFSALLELLDNQRFARGVPPDRKQLSAVMVRRLKQELPPRWDGTPRFSERQIAALEVDYSEAERRAHQLLLQYTASRQRRAADETEKVATEFVLKLLKKRLFSSPAAFASTLEKHEHSIRAARKRKAAVTHRPGVGVLRRQIDGIEEEFADDEAYEEATGEVIDTSSRLFQDLSDEEQTLLKALREFAASAYGRADAKAATLLRWLHENIKSHGQWSNMRVLIFTEYRATQKWLQGLLAAEGLTEGGRLLTLYGGMSVDDRERIKAAFQASPTVSPVRILLATDAASEGIDLQNHCSRLIHYEIPWNPNRMEQRNGRLDRHGQRAPVVQVYHFVGKGYKERELQKTNLSPGQLEGDLEFLMRAVQKVETIREDLGKVGPVIAQQVEEAMLGRRQRLETERAERDAQPARQMLSFERKLREQIAQLHEQLLETKNELRISPANIKRIVDIALELAGQPPLREAKVDGLWPDRSGKWPSCPVFHLPALHGSWALCAQGLAHPHTGEIRPIVFDHALASRRDDVVLAHLNHRLVQMCLHLLRAEIWSHNENKQIHRVTARLVPDQLLDTPAVVAHGRLIILGGDNHRLHEEIILAGGFIREGRFARMNVSKSEELVKAAISKPAPKEIRDRLASLWPQLCDALLQSLHARMNERTTGLHKKIEERAAKEANDMKAILTELQKSIAAELESAEPSQLELFTTAEREQFERNKGSLRLRLAEIPEEMEREISAIGKRFANPSPRLFPVAVTFFVPEKFVQSTDERQKANTP